MLKAGACRGRKNTHQGREGKFFTQKGVFLFRKLLRGKIVKSIGESRRNA